MARRAEVVPGDLISMVQTIMVTIAKANEIIVASEDEIPGAVTRTIGDDGSVCKTVCGVYVFDRSKPNGRTWTYLNGRFYRVVPPRKPI